MNQILVHHDQQRAASQLNVLRGTSMSIIGPALGRIVVGVHRTGLGLFLERRDLRVFDWSVRHSRAYSLAR